MGSEINDKDKNLSSFLALDLSAIDSQTICTLSVTNPVWDITLQMVPGRLRVKPMGRAVTRAGCGKVGFDHTDTCWEVWRVSDGALKDRLLWCRAISRRSF